MVEEGQRKRIFRLNCTGLHEMSKYLFIQVRANELMRRYSALTLLSESFLPLSFLLHQHLFLLTHAFPAPALQLLCLFGNAGFCFASSRLGREHVGKHSFEERRWTYDHEVKSSFPPLRWIVWLIISGVHQID
jgi:hypothetical protein